MMMMELSSDQQSINSLLKETILLLCKNGLHFKSQLSIEGLIGITLDGNQVLLVNINEKIKADEPMPHSEVESNSDPSLQNVDKSIVPPKNDSLPGHSDINGVVRVAQKRKFRTSLKSNVKGSSNNGSCKNFSDAANRNSSVSELKFSALMEYNQTNSTTELPSKLVLESSCVEKSVSADAPSTSFFVDNSKQVFKCEPVDVHDSVKTNPEMDGNIFSDAAAAAAASWIDNHQLPDFQNWINNDNWQVDTKFQSCAKRHRNNNNHVTLNVNSTTPPSSGSVDQTTPTTIRYKCTICTSGFKLSRDLRAHMSSKHNLEKDFSCHVCGTGFTYKHNLLVHLRTVHGLQV